MEGLNSPRVPSVQRSERVTSCTQCACVAIGRRKVTSIYMTTSCREHLRGEMKVATTVGGRVRGREDWCGKEEPIERLEKEA